jgi:flagellar motor component MotA
MDSAAFLEEYAKIAQKTLGVSEKARGEGLLALTDELDEAKADGRDIFEYGLRFVIDGVDRNFIEKILSNIINQETDEQIRTLKIIQKEAVLAVQEGLNPRLLSALLNSYTPVPLNDDPLKG